MPVSTCLQNDAQSSPTLFFSVIIPTYNSFVTLAPLLESLEKQTFKNFETILVDDASTDGTDTEVKRFNLKYHSMEARGGPAAARNYGAGLAQGEWLVFTDADTLFSGNTLEKIEEALRGHEMDALVGTYAGKPANSGFMPRYKAMWESLAIDEVLALKGEKYIPYTAWAPRPGVVRKDVFHALGGFNESFRGADLEDVDFGYRLAAAGYHNYFVPAVQIKHHYPATFTKEIKAFARRCAIWMQMKREHGLFDDSGEGTPRQALVHILGFTTSFLLFPCIILHWLLIPVVILFFLYFFASRKFLVRAWKEEGCWFTLRAAVVCWIHTIVLGVAASYGLLLRLMGSRL